MPETVFTARGNFAQLVADAIAARDALQGIDKTVTAKAKLDKSDVDVQKNIVDKQLDQLQRRIATATLRADGKQATAEIAKLEAQLARMRAQANNINVKADTAKATAQLSALSKEADLVARNRNLKIDADTGKAVGQIGLLAGALDFAKKKGDIFKGGFISDILQVVGFLSGPLAVAISAAIVGIAGLVSVVGALGLGFGALGIVIAPIMAGLGKNIKSVTTAQTALNNAVTDKEKLDALKKMDDAYKKIPKDQVPVVKLVVDLQNALRKIGDEVMPAVLHALSGFLSGFKAVLPFVAELAHATANALSVLGDRFQAAGERAAKSPYWQQVIHVIRDELTTYILDLGRIFGNLFSGLVKLIAGFAPAGQTLLDWIIVLSEKFNNWATSKGPEQVRKIIEYLHENGPKLSETLHNIVRAFTDLSVALAKLPLSGATLDVINQLAKVLDEIVKTPVGAWAVGLLLMSGGILRIVSSLAGKVGMVIDFARGIQGVGEAAKFGSPGAYAFGSALDFMLGPVGLIIVGLLALGAAIFAIVHWWKQISDFLHQHNWMQFIVIGVGLILGPIFALIAIGIEMAMHWRGVWNVMQQIGDWIRTAFFAVWHALVDVWHVVVEAIKVGWAIWKAEFNAAKTVVEAVWHAIMDAFHFARDVIVGVIDYISDHWSTIWRIIVLVLFGAIGYIVAAIITHFNEIKDFILGVMNFVWHNIIEPVWNAIRSVIDVVMGVIIAIVTGGHGRIRDVIDAVMNFIWHSIIEPIWNGIKATIDFVVNTIWHGIIEPAFNGIKDAILTAVNFIWHQVIEPAFNAISDVISRVVGFIWHSIIEPAWTTISDITSRVWNGIKDTIVTMIQIASDLVKPIINGIIGFINGIAKGIKAVAGFIHVDVGYGDPAIQPLAKGGVIAYDGVVRAMAGGGCMDCELGASMMGGGVGRVGAGFRTTGPTAIVGEGRQQYPEYVIPTDPAFRGNAYGLAASMLMDIGLMRSGGVFRGRIGSLEGDIGTGIDLNPWHVAKSIWHGAENVGGAALSAVGDAGKWVMDRVRDGIASAVEGLAHTLGYKWPTTPPWWGAGFPGESGIIGGAGNDVVGKIIELIKGKEASAKAASGAGIGGSGPAVTGECADWINQGLNWPGANKSFSPACMAARVRNESGCNPRIVNLWDSNARAGTPSGGLAQFIQPTFASQSCPGCTDFWNPVCQVCASSHCSPGNCGQGGYNCASGAMLGKGGIPGIDGVPPGAPRRAWISALERMQGRRVLGQTTGEKMLLGMVNQGLEGGGTISARALLSNATHFPSMASGGVMGRMPRLAAGGAMGGSNRTNNINIYNPVGETAEDSLSTTLTKLSYRGVLR